MDSATLISIDDFPYNDNKKHIGKLLDDDTVAGNTEVLDLHSTDDAHNVHSIGDKGIDDFLKSLILSKKPAQSLLFIDLAKVQRLYRKWKELLPRVEVFYAVKCNPDAGLIRYLAELGSGFDCASEWEIQAVMDKGVPASRIIFANPCKQPKQMTTAQNLGIQLMTFDSKGELEKISRYTPDAKALIRIQADDPTAMYFIGRKFGAKMTELPEIYATAKSVGVDVVGVAFHIGTGARDPKAFTAAITLAREAFDVGLQQGFNMSILDIGGGFSSGTMSSFEDMTRAVNAALDLYFPTESGVRIIAEPGRYLIQICAMIASRIFGVRERTIDGVLRRDYWIPDGKYGSFCPLSVGFTKINVSPIKFSETTHEGTFSSTVFGPTCDGVDFILEDVVLPKLFVDDWLLFADMGAYTSVLSCNFNGMLSNMDSIDIRTGLHESI